jgi:N-acetylmuramoyl-L-alanine amidase
MALNRGLDPLALVPGRQIRLKESAPPPGKNRRRRRPVPTYYVVRRGDTLSGIAAKFGVPLYRVFELNRAIRPNTLLLPGQRIRLHKPTIDKRKRPPRRET